MPAAKLLEVESLVTGFQTDTAFLTAVDGVSFAVDRGETLGIVGESGCGKSVTALSLMRLLPQPAGRIVGGEIKFQGLDLATLPADDMKAIRGQKVAMIFQEPMTALNPLQPVGRQLMEIMFVHGEKDKRKALVRAVDLLDKVGIPSPDLRLKDYPHQLSGGMRQRVMIAMALACDPDLLIADEPTTALDVTVQAQILSLIKDLQKEHHMAVILITHDLGVIAEMADEVVVMYAGQVVEQAPVSELFARPTHPYTHALLSSIPRLDRPPKERLPTIEGIVPALNELPEGCRFQGRCRFRQPACEAPVFLEDAGAGHVVRCARWRELSLGATV